MSKSVQELEADLVAARQAEAEEKRKQRDAERAEEARRRLRAQLQAEYDSALLAVKHQQEKLDQRKKHALEVLQRLEALDA